MEDTAIQCNKQRDSLPGDPKLLEKAVSWIQEARVMTDIDFLQMPSSEQDEIVKSYEEKLHKIRNNCVKRLEKAVDATDDLQRKERLQKQVDAYNNLTQWVNLIAPENSSIPGKSSNISSASAFVGNCDRHQNVRTSK